MKSACVKGFAHDTMVRMRLIAHKRGCEGAHLLSDGAEDAPLQQE